MTRRRQIQQGHAEAMSDKFNSSAYVDNLLWRDKNIFTDGFYSGVKWMDEHPNWINPKEEMPGPNDCFLAVDRCGEMVVGHCMEVRGEDYCCYNSDGNLFDDVVAWMPLPKAPER